MSFDFDFDVDLSGVVEGVAHVIGAVLHAIGSALWWILECIGHAIAAISHGIVNILSSLTWWGVGDSVIDAAAAAQGPSHDRRDNNKQNQRCACGETDHDDCGCH